MSVISISVHKAIFTIFINIFGYFNATLGQYLRAQSIRIQSSTCDITATWDPPPKDQDLVVGYQIVLSKYQVVPSEYQVISSETCSVGNQIKCRTPCKLQPGLRYTISIRSKIQLSDPKEEMDVDSDYHYTILGKYIDYKY